MPAKFLALIAMAAFLLLSLSAEAAPDQKRVALVIGNSAYQNVASLPNPGRDAAGMAQLFKNAGFNSVTLRQDLTVVEFKRALRDFFDTTQDADVAVVYYAGHGVQVGDMNYMIPVDARLATEIDVQDEAVSLDRILTTLQPAKRLRLVILDACRENPFLNRMKMTYASRSVSRGLARIEPENNSLVAYAAKGGQIAQDGGGEHSPFTAALMKHLPVPGLDIRLALGRVRDDVYKSTASKQEPFVYGSLGGDSVSLIPAPAEARPAALTDVKSDYEMVERVGTRKAWEAFLASHQEGLYSELARAQLAKLSQTGGPAMKPGATATATADISTAQTRVTVTEPAASSAPTVLSGNEKTDWERVKNSGDTNALRAFIAQYPDSFRAEMARGRLEGIQHRTDMAALQDDRTPDPAQRAVSTQQQQPDNALSPVLSAIGELRKLGCVAGQNDPALSGAVSDAIRLYLAEKGRPAEDIKVVDSLLADLKAENERLCAAEGKPVAKPAKRENADANARQRGVVQDKPARPAKAKRERPYRASAQPNPDPWRGQRNAPRRVLLIVPRDTGAPTHVAYPAYPLSRFAYPMGRAGMGF